MRDYDAEAKILPDGFYGNNFDMRMHHYIMREFTPYFAGNSALEMGCHKGEFTKLLVDRFGDVTIIEAAKEMLHATNATYIHSTFESADLKMRFDNIFLINTLEHVDDPIVVLNKAHDWLSGYIFIVVPNANSPSRQIAVSMGLMERATDVMPHEWEHGHRRTYNLDTLCVDIKKSKLKIVTTGGIFFKGLSNSQLDSAHGQGIVSNHYMDGCYELGHKYPDLCASIFAVCKP